MKNFVLVSTILSWFLLSTQVMASETMPGKSPYLDKERGGLYLDKKGFYREGNKGYGKKSSYWTIIRGKVERLEPTHLPRQFFFVLDAHSVNNGGVVQCRYALYRSSDKENTMAMYSTLLAALMSGVDVSLYTRADDSDCQAAYIDIINR